VSSSLSGLKNKPSRRQASKLWAGAISLSALLVMLAGFNGPFLLYWLLAIPELQTNRHLKGRTASVGFEVLTSVAMHCYVSLHTERNVELTTKRPQQHDSEEDP
jgi:hypothetical protein